MKTDTRTEQEKQLDVFIRALRAQRQAFKNSGQVENQKRVEKTLKKMIVERYIKKAVAEKKAAKQTPANN